MPVISVIIPTHNRPALLAEAIASVRGQTFSDYEIIVISNGESLDTRAQSKAVATLYDARWYALSAGNAGAARNFGVEQTKSEWIAFLDDDDIWLPQKLEHQIVAARRSGADLIACDIVNFFPDGSEVEIKMRLPPDVMYVEALCRQKWWGPTPSAVLLRRSVFDGLGGFDPKLITHEDSDLWRRVSWRHTIFQMDEILLHYRSGHPSLSSNKQQYRRDQLYHYRKIWQDTPPDLRWALPNPARLPLRWLSTWWFPAWLRQPRKYVRSLNLNF